MHRCLEVKEVVLYIVDHLASSWEDRGALASLARTCKLLSDAALDALWRNQNGFDHFLPLLPEDATEEGHDQEGNTVLQIARRIDDDEWHKFDKYAARVRNFSATVWEDPIDTYGYLLERGVKSGLFPSLRFLEWNDPLDRIDPLWVLHALLVPSLSELDIATRNAVEAAAVFSQISRACPGMLSIGLRNDVDSKINTPLTPPKLDLGPDLRSLTELFLPDGATPSELLLQLGRLPSLEVLRYSPSAQDQTLFSLVPSTGTPFFRSLKRIIFACASHHSHLRPMMELIQPNTLLAVYIKLQVVNASVLHAVFHMLHSNPAFLSITFFRIKTAQIFYKMVERHPSALMPPPIDAATVRPLLLYRHLRSIELGLGSACHFDGALVDMIGNTWPGLRQLVLGVVEQYTREQVRAALRRPPSLNVATLARLLARCPELRALTISQPIDCADAGDAPPLPEPRPTELHDLHVGFARVEVADVGPLAALLAVTAPRLEKVEHIWRSFGPELPNELYEARKDRWEEVDASLKEYRLEHPPPVDDPELCPYFY